MQDASKVLLGATRSSAKTITEHESDPANTPAGYFASLSSTGALSVLRSAGMRVGVSLGRSLSNTKQTSLCRAGD